MVEARGAADSSQWNPILQRFTRDTLARTGKVSQMTFANCSFRSCAFPEARNRSTASALQAPGTPKIRASSLIRPACAGLAALAS